MMKVWFEVSGGDIWIMTDGNSSRYIQWLGNIEDFLLDVKQAVLCVLGAPLMNYATNPSIKAITEAIEHIRSHGINEGEKYIFEV